MPAVLRLILAAMILLAGIPAASARVFYVDCSAARQGSGTLVSPWNSVAAVNRWQAFAPGDSIRLRAGTRCAGALAPKGEGARGRPIFLTSYGKGPKPVIAAGTASAALSLSDQSWWSLSNLHTTGGTRWGVHVTAVAGLVRGIELRDLLVENVTGGKLDSKNTGLVVIAPEPVDVGNAARARFDGVLVDGVIAHSTTMWAGILVGTGAPRSSWYADETRRSSNVVVRNSTADHIYGDGIILFAVSNGLLEHNVVHHSGIQPTKTIGTPNAIWTWACNRCTVQYNEAYENDSPDIDGGAFDIDYMSRDSIVQYNYGHDNSAYCIAIFAAEQSVTSNSIIRYNVCANNGTQNVKQRTELEIVATDGGSIDGVRIYGNTFFTANHLINVSAGALAGNLPRLFFNNIVYSSAPGQRDEVEGFTSTYNLWFLPNGEVRRREPNSVYRDPLFVGSVRTGMRALQDFRLTSRSPAINAGAAIPDAGGRDYFGVRVPTCGRFDIGAAEFAGCGRSR